MIVFVRTRHDYPSYTDYWRLVELAGFPVTYSDEMQRNLMWTNPDATFIVSPVNGEYGPDHFVDPARRAKVVWWNLERPGCDSSMKFPIAHEDKRFDETWVSDRFYATLGANHEKPYRYVTLGTDMRLRAEDCDPERDLPECYHARGMPTDGRPLQWKDVGTTFKYDVIHLSYLSHRRQHVIPNILKATGWTCAPTGWGQDRHQALLESRAMLAVHQDDWPVVEPLRYALAAAYGLPVWGEAATDHYPWVREPELHQRLDCGLVLLRPPPLDQYNFRKLVEEACKR